MSLFSKHNYCKCYFYTSVKNFCTKTGIHHFSIFSIDLLCAMFLNIFLNCAKMSAKLTHCGRALFWPILPLVAAFLAFCNSQKLCFPFPPYPSVIYQFHHWDVYSRSMPLVLSKNEYSKKYRLETKPYFFTFQLI